MKRKLTRKQIERLVREVIADYRASRLDLYGRWLKAGKRARRSNSMAR